MTTTTSTPYERSFIAEAIRDREGYLPGDGVTARWSDGAIEVLQGTGVIVTLQDERVIVTPGRSADAETVALVNEVLADNGVPHRIVESDPDYTLAIKGRSLSHHFKASTPHTFRKDSNDRWTSHPEVSA